MLLFLLRILLFTEGLKHVNSAAITLTSHEHGAGNVTQATDDPETLAEADLLSHGVAVVEGDVLLSRDRSPTIHLWPTLNIPFVISSGLADRANEILAALEVLSLISCVTFHKRTTEVNYLHFIKSKGCASYVGFNGGDQGVFIGPSCQLGNIVHEILHALGTTHEHTRTDRDEYINVLTENIESGKERNFHKKPSTHSLSNPYDLTSIMHYGRFVFSRNGLPTIEPLVKDEHTVRYMGQRFKVTQLDGVKLRSLYHCVSNTNQNGDVFLF